MREATDARFGSRADFDPQILMSACPRKRTCRLAAMSAKLPLADKIDVGDAQIVDKPGLGRPDLRLFECEEGPDCKTWDTNGGGMLAPP